jgi:hypothetical protein
MFSDAVGIRTPLTPTAFCILELLAPKYISPVLFEIGITQMYAVAGQYGWGIPAVAGEGRRNPFYFQPEDPSSPASLTAIYMDWTSTRPTSPTTFIRKVTLVASAGTGIIWAFPRGIIITKATSVVAWAISTCPPCDMWIIIDE